MNDKNVSDSYDSSTTATRTANSEVLSLSMSELKSREEVISQAIPFVTQMMEDYELHGSIVLYMSKVHTAKSLVRYDPNSNENLTGMRQQAMRLFRLMFTSTQVNDACTNITLWKDKFYNLRLFGNRIVRYDNGMELSIGGFDFSFLNPFRYTLLRFPYWPAWKIIQSLPMPVVVPALLSVNLSTNPHLKNYQKVSEMCAQGFDQMNIIFGGMALDHLNNFSQYHEQFNDHYNGPSRRLYNSKNILVQFWQSQPRITETVYSFSNTALLMSKIKLNQSGPYEECVLVDQGEMAGILVSGFLRSVVMPVETATLITTYYNTQSATVKLKSMIWNIWEMLPLSLVLSSLHEILLCNHGGHADCAFQIFPRAGSSLVCDKCGSDLTRFRNQNINCW
ncbi:MAG: hypothetical protein GY928_31105 [Colwellia sp.]|nr:hypothetical protein [Colwellia sp.]